jgi:GntR family transcriptional regulator
LLYRNSITVRPHILRLDPSAGLPLYLQLMEQIKHAVEMCQLAPGDQLPSVRGLAQELVISPNTVVKAYSELAAEGVIELRQGTGAFIADQERQPEAADALRSAHAEMRRLVARLRERGLSDGEIRRLLESELLSGHEPAVKRGQRT